MITDAITLINSLQIKWPHRSEALQRIRVEKKRHKLIARVIKELKKGHTTVGIALRLINDQLTELGITEKITAADLTLD